MKKLLICFLIIILTSKANAQTENISIARLSVSPSIVESCSTAEVNVEIFVATTQYNNKNHEAVVKIALPGFYYTRRPADVTGPTPVNDEENFDMQMEVWCNEDCNGNVYWEEPYIETDHSLVLELKKDAEMEYGMRIFWKVTGLEVDDAQNYSSTIEAVIQQFTDSNDADDESSVPTETTTTCTIVPIELSAFNATSVGNDGMLEWSTASEINNSHFEIQRSIDGNNFETIGRVEGAGTTQEYQNYSFVDVDASSVAQKLYYRLKQVDFDGEFDFSSVEMIEFSSGNNLSIYPNPVTKNENLITLEGAKFKQVEIYNLLGQLIYSKAYEKNPDKVSIATEDFAAGVYVVTVNNKQQLKFVVE